MNRPHLYYFFALLLILGTGCEESNEEDCTTASNEEYAAGVYVVNEGTFQAGNASISYYNSDLSETYQTIFQRSDCEPKSLGDVAQSITFHEDKGYIVVNNSNTVEVVHADNFRTHATITGLELPRFLEVVSDDKAYISQWGSDGLSGSLQVLDLSDLSITASIQTGGQGPEKMLQIDDRLYVGHAGGYASDSHIAIIDTAADTLLTQIPTMRNPAELLVDGVGRLWVLSLGYYDFATNETYPAYLSCYDYPTHSLIKEFELPMSYPADLHINAAGDRLYFIHNSQIVAQDTEASSLNLEVIADDASFYSLGYDPSTDIIYGADAADFQSAGRLRAYDAAGVFQGEWETGIAPGDITIKNE